MFNKVGFIIPCYWANEELLDMTLDCVLSLHDTTTEPHYEILLVDDGSPLKYPEEVPYIYERSTNGGYAAAVNSGLDMMSDKDYDYDVLVICNNDIKFIQPDWFSQLLKPLEEGYDISSIRTTDSDGWEVEDKITEGDKFGSLWAMKRKVYETIGGLDESFGRGYFEDLDYQVRAEAAGFRVAKNHAGLAEHIGKATFKVVEDNDASYKAAREVFRKKHGKVW